MSTDFDHSEYLNLLTKRLIESFRPKKALDVGCRTGELVNILQKYGVKAYGIDISKQPLSHANDVIQDALLCQADAEEIPFKDDTFDLVTAHHLIEHLKNPDYFIRECKRILRPDGVVCIVVPVSPLGLTKLWRALKLQRDRAHLSMHSKTFWIKTFRKEGLILIGDLQEIVIKDPPSSFWLGVWLINQGSIGKWLWLRLEGYIRKSFLFKLEDYQKKGKCSK